MRMIRGDPPGKMRIIETPVFTRALAKLIGEDRKQELLDELIAHPNSGDIIKGSGGIRKVRWSAPGRGKRGGIRIIYFWQVAEILYLLAAYPKNVKDDLSAQELNILRQIVEQEKKSWIENSSKT